MTLDTLAIYERLKAADLPEPAARAIAELFRIFVEERLVTKEYFDLRMKELEYKIKALEEHTNLRLKELEERIRIQLASEIRGVETRLIRWIFAMGVATITVITALMKLLR